MRYLLEKMEEKENLLVGKFSRNKTCKKKNKTKQNKTKQNKNNNNNKKTTTPKQKNKNKTKQNNNKKKTTKQTNKQVIVQVHRIQTISEYPLPSKNHSHRLYDARRSVIGHIMSVGHRYWTHDVS